MSDPTNKSKLAALKETADTLGISYHPNIGEDALSKKIADHTSAVVETTTVKRRNINLREYLKQQSMKLVRIRISCLDPKKKELPGEIFTVANEYIGTVRKFVPYGDATDDGYHVPQCLYEMLNNSQFLSIRTVKDKNGNSRIETSYVRQFAIEVLPPLTTEELRELATAQQAAGSID
jgi:hypothetical protein